MSGLRPNGSPDRNRLPTPTPQERALWLASHRAPENFRILTTAELSVMASQLQRASVYEVEFRSTIVELDRWGYWKEFPDVKTAAGAAAFDARRYERATTAAIARIEKTLAFLKLLNEENDAPTRTIDLVGEISALRELLVFLRQQAAAKVEVKPETPPRG